jgi:ATP-dependent Zn protease
MPIDWISLLLSWVPFIVLILVWIILSRRAGSTRWSLARMIEFYEAQVAEMQRTNALLDRIAGALEKRAEK